MFLLLPIPSQGFSADSCFVCSYSDHTDKNENSAPNGRYKVEHWHKLSLNNPVEDLIKRLGIKVRPNLRNRSVLDC